MNVPLSLLHLSAKDRDTYTEKEAQHSMKSPSVQDFSCRANCLKQPRPELVHLPAWWEAMHPGRERGGSHGSLTCDPGAGVASSFIFSHSWKPGSVPILPQAVTFQMTPSLWMVTLLPKSVSLYPEENFEVSDLSFLFSLFSPLALGGAWHRVDIHKYILNKWKYRWMNEQVNLTLTF